MAKTLEDLREHLFATLEDLRKKDNPMEIDRAKAISEVAQTVIASAKAEVEYVRAIGRQDAALPVFGEAKQITGPSGASPSGDEQPGVRTHRIRG